MCLQTEDICNTLQTSITLHWACRLLWVDWWLALGRPPKRTAPVPSHTAPPPASPNALGNRNHASTRFHTPDFTTRLSPYLLACLFPAHLSEPRLEIDTKLQAPEGEGMEKQKREKKKKKTLMPGLVPQ